MERANNRQQKAWLSKASLFFTENLRTSFQRILFESFSITFIPWIKSSFKFSHTETLASVISYWLHKFLYRQAIEINIYDIIIRI